MKLPKRFKDISPFMGNFFCLIPNSNLAFVVISKNACTFLKKVAVYNETGEWIENSDEIDARIGYSEESKYLIKVSKIKQYEQQNGKLIKFAVWRDPVHRLISMYKYFCLEREFRTYFHYLNMYEDCAFERVIEILQFEMKKSNPLKQDEHFRRQSSFYKQKDVDFIIPISDINQFLTKNNVQFLSEETNKTSTSFNITDEDQIKLIREIYKPDYKIRIKSQWEISNVLGSGAVL